MLPAGCVLAALVLAVGLPRIDVRSDRALATRLFPGGPESARSFLSSITSAMISFTGLVSSITIVALQLASGQFSSRILRNYLRDRVNQAALGVFVATFLRDGGAARGAGHQRLGRVRPQLAVTAAFLLVLASVGVFIGYITHIANSLRVAAIGVDTRRVLERRYPQRAPVRAGGPPSGAPVSLVACR